MLAVTAFFAGLFAFMLIGLSAVVIVRRRAGKVSLGDGGDRQLLRAMRAQGNFCEYVPFCLLLMGISEANKIFPPVIVLMGILLLVGRGLHAYGVLSAEAHEKPNYNYRVSGMVITLSVLGLLALMVFVSI